MKLIKEIRTESEAYQVYDCDRSVMIMTSTIWPNGHLEHQSGVDIDRSALDQVIAALSEARRPA